jgi:hypothetical protein
MPTLKILYRKILNIETMLNIATSFSHRSFRPYLIGKISVI